MHFKNVYYLKKDCGSDDPTDHLFLRVLAPNSNMRLDILEEIPLGEASERSMWYEESKCYVKRYLDYWPLYRIQTGEYREGKLLWEGTFSVDSEQEVANLLAPHRNRYMAVAGRDPIARSHWNVHVFGREIIHLKDPCHSVDLDEDFVMHVLPARSVKSSELESRSDGFILYQWNDFRRVHGNSATVGSSMFDGKCILTYLLPDFPVAAVKTGQRNIWEVTFNLDVQNSSAGTGPKAGVAP